MKVNFGYVIVPKNVVIEKRKIRFMYREEPDNSEDSGWRFFSGDEDQSYIDDPDNLGIYDINSVILIDPDVEELLESDIGTAYERVDDQKKFVKSEGFRFGEDL